MSSDSTSTSTLSLQRSQKTQNTKMSSAITDSTGKVVCAGNYKTYKYTADAMSKIAKSEFFNEENFENIKKSIAYDGTMIRVFYHDGVWKKATTNCFDAYDASWGFIPSFGGLFDEIASLYNFDYSLLCPSNTYVFVISHPRYRHVEVQSSPLFIHIDTINNESGQSVDDYIKVQKPLSLTYNTLDEMVDFLNHPDTPWMFQGFVLINSKQERLILVNPQYNKVAKLRGNCMTRGHKWELSQTAHPDTFQMLKVILNNREADYLYYFPEHAQQIIFIKEDLFSLSGFIMEEYRQKYIYKTPDNYQNDTFTGHLHKIYKQTRTRITIHDARQVVYNCPIVKLMTTLGYARYTNYTNYTN
jgi:hypothetical protein